VKIAVCIKRVPVMEVKFAISPDGKRVEETGLKYDVNDFDLWAVEAALQLKEKDNAGEVTVISLGPDAAQEQLRKALAMGADKGVLLKVDAPPSDGLAIARALADELRGGSYDIVLPDDGPDGR
jgi:electron transfer flavoprotein beta subunit